MKHASSILHKKEVLNELTNEKEKYKALFENNSVGICIVDLEGNMLDCNKELLNMTKMSKYELMSNNISTYYVDKNARTKILDQLEKNGKTSIHEVEFFNGKIHLWTSLDCTKFKYKEKDYIITTIDRKSVV